MEFIKIAYCKALCSKLAEFRSHSELDDVLRHLADRHAHSTIFGRATETEDLAIFVGAHYSGGWHWDSNRNGVNIDLFLGTQSHSNGNCLMASYHSLMLLATHQHYRTQEGLVAQPCSSNYAPLCQIASH